MGNRRGWLRGQLCVSASNEFHPHILSLSVKGPELINMYVGQSEENVREGE